MTTLIAAAMICVSLYVMTDKLDDILIQLKDINWKSRS